MLDTHLCQFYSGWDNACQKPMGKQNDIVIKALEYYKGSSAVFSMAMLENDLLKEMADRWYKTELKK